MNKTFNIVYSKVNIISTSVKSINSEEDKSTNIDITSVLFARGYGKMIKEITAKFLLSNVIKNGTIDRFIEDIAEIDALKKLSEKNTITDEVATDNKIISTIREKYNSFAERWNRYFEGELSWNEI